MVSSMEEGLQKKKSKVKGGQDRDFEFLEGIHIESQKIGKGKELVEVANMQKVSFNYLDKLATRIF